MTVDVNETAKEGASAGDGHPPFLVWPVSRREFYMSIGVALLPALAWGTIVFGWRAAGMLVVTVAAAFIVHTVLKRWTVRGKKLVLAHSVVSAMVLVALSGPLWPGWTVALGGAAIPALLWIVGGPGREPVHIAVVVALLLQLIAAPLQHAEWRDAILASDRLVMGDIRSQREGSVYRWPGSAALGGDDAVRMEKPERVAMETLDHMRPAELARADEAFPSTRTGVGREARKRVQQMLDVAIGKRLPSMEMLILGAVPGRVGTVSLVALAIGGLFLGYRYILRPRSVGFFFVSFVLGMMLTAIWPGGSGGLGFRDVWTVWSAFPEELAALLSYAIFNSDVVFAAVMILALPGTEPLTARGRRMFLVTAGLLAAGLTRSDWGFPAATVAICALMPLTPWFDHWFAKRSWLSGAMRRPSHK